MGRGGGGRGQPYISNNVQQCATRNILSRNVFGKEARKGKVGNEIPKMNNTEKSDEIYTKNGNITCDIYNP